ncbi:MAG TPA: TIR domain-containing protein [Pyrinomonadaceae bacterium]|nr:TIR domain-containing protein [Pyrinomonadaceae bacterium]
MEMEPPHFFLSYARANHSPLVKKFFEDLSDTIRIASRLPRNQSVGFYEELEHKPTSDWSAGAREALQTSRTMVALLSDAYFHSEHGSKEWQVFEMRRRQCVKRQDLKEKTPESLVHVIVPVTWIQLQGPVPKVVSEMLAYPDRLYQSRSIMQMLNSSGAYLAEYADLVKTVANEIMRMMAKSTLLPLDSLPSMSEVHSAFRLWEASGITADESRHRPTRGKAEFSDLGLDKGPAEPKEPAARMRVDVSGAPSDVKSQSTKTDKYSVYIIDNNRQALGFTKKCCEISGLFKKVETKDDYQKALRDISNQQRKELPDLIVIDLGNEMQGLEVIKELCVGVKAPSAILAISGNLEQGTLYQFMANKVLSKPINRNELRKEIERCAKIGRNCHNYHKTKARDLSRRREPVFLSFCFDDEIPATPIRRSLEALSIGVWYSRAGDKLTKEIQKAIEEAQIFVAFISESYWDSGYCMAELTNFYQRLGEEQSDTQPPVLIPVLYNSPDTSKDKFIDDCVNDHIYIRMSEEDYLNGLNELLGRIQDILSDNDND